MSTRLSDTAKRHHEIARAISRKVIADLKDNLIGDREDLREAREMVEFHIRRELKRYDDNVEPDAMPPHISVPPGAPGSTI